MFLLRVLKLELNYPQTNSNKEEINNLIVLVESKYLFHVDQDFGQVIPARRVVVVVLAELLCDEGQRVDGLHGGLLPRLAHAQQAHGPAHDGVNHEKNRTAVVR